MEQKVKTNEEREPLSALRQCIEAMHDSILDQVEENDCLPWLAAKMLNAWAENNIEEISSIISRLHNSLYANPPAFLSNIYNSEDNLISLLSSNIFMQLLLERLSNECGCEVSILSSILAESNEPNANTMEDSEWPIQ